MSKAETINVWLTKGDQSVTYTELLAYKDFRLRIAIKSDAYAKQSFAKIDVFSLNQLQWNSLWVIPQGGMETKSGLHHAPDWEKSIHFQRDRLELISNVVEIL
jgi:hypothetical protein